MNKSEKYVSVILPLAIPKTYTYIVPEHLLDKVSFGKRVEVQLRNKLYSALVVEFPEEVDTTHKLKHIISVLDNTPIITESQFELWAWISKYYMSTIGEVMNVALPSGLKLNSETKIISNADYDDLQQELTDDEYLVVEAVSIQNELSIDQIREILNKKTVYPVIHSLLSMSIILIKEELQQGYKPRMTSHVKVADFYLASDKNMTTAFDAIGRSEKQTFALLALVKLKGTEHFVQRSLVCKEAGVDTSVVNALVKKGILVKEDRQESRIKSYDSEEHGIPPMSDDQIVAHKKIVDKFEDKDCVLLHGVTGSGKTRVYIELIQEAIDQGKQVLYLLPEIALTTQVVARLRVVFGNKIGLYHSKLNNHERVEVWQNCMKGQSVVLGARSSLFLPFRDLSLIIIDEEHDPSYKQNDPSPRYNGRDAAHFLAKSFGAKILLGTATPSLETFYNVKQEKYGLVELTERYGEALMPAIEVIDMQYQQNTNRVKDYLSLDLREAIRSTLDEGEQVLLFQNRRGYAPILTCDICAWVAECVHCDVSLTYHQFHDELRCHYCSHRTRKMNICSQCGSDKLSIKGLGTQKIEEIIGIHFEDATIKRMDYDTAKTRRAFERIITDFEQRKIDILVGTQMITKGLDFDNIGLVGILNADGIIYFPDFRSHERAFQLFTQVSGRAGRKKKRGRVIIQSYSPTHPILSETINNDFDGFYNREERERARFVFPPHIKLIGVLLKHKKSNTVADAANYLVKELKPVLGNRVVGPSVPGIARIRNMYQQYVLIKMENDPVVISRIKTLLSEKKSQLVNAPGFKSVRVNIDVDPY